MKEIYAIIITSIAGISTLLGNILLFIPSRFKNKLLSFSLGLSFIVMFLISIIELIPDALHLLINKTNNITLFSLSLIYLIIGVIIVKICDKNIQKEDVLYRVGILSMLSLLIHNIPEGIICAMTTLNNFSLGLKMTFIIMLHNIPEGICIALPIFYATKSKKKAILYTLISGLGEVAGAIFMITAGIMIYLSLNKILKTGLKYKESKYLIIGIIIGIIILFITL